MAPQAKFRENVDGNKLDLSMCGLTEAPVKDIAGIKKATVLDLSNNQLTLLPSTFSSLTHLVELDLSKNLLRELPDSFGSLVNLKRLDLYGNQLTYLPLSFCHLKSLRWLDLKNNPLVPMLAEIAGPCGDTQQCQQCARNVVATLTKTATKVEEDRKRILEEKLREQELIEQELKRKEGDMENQKKAKKKPRKVKSGKHDPPNAAISALEKQSAEKVKKSTEEKRDDSNVASQTPGFLQRILLMVWYLMLFCGAVLLLILVSCVIFATYEQKMFLQIVEDYNIASSSVTSFVVGCAKHVENAAKHPFVKEVRSQLAACFESVMTSILNICKTFF